MKKILFLLVPFVFFCTVKAGGRKSPYDRFLPVFFNDTTAVKKHRIYLKKQELEHLQQKVSARFKSPVISYYVSQQTDSSAVYLFFVNEIIRTQPAVIGVLLDQSGTVKDVKILAFYEPPDYRPPQNWLEIFFGKKSPAPFRLYNDIPVTTGATLTAQMFSREIRKIVYLFEQKIRDEK